MWNNKTFIPFNGSFKTFALGIYLMRFTSSVGTPKYDRISIKRFGVIRQVLSYF